MLLPPRRPRKIVILGDTCNPAAIEHLAKDADVLVHESTCMDEDLSAALRQKHSTAGMAGAFARRINARHLILNHFSPRCFEHELQGSMSPIGVMVRQAQRQFKNDSVHAAKVGEAVASF